ncbi:MAG: DUF2341 domain-containing protein, partial [Kiritimatiellae bacterium]|nr:DUF2341 domain-containing protein [Kiritimatiellia bacterium]
PIGEWLYVAGTWTNGSPIRLYSNAVEWAVSTNTTGMLPDDFSGVDIGGMDNGTDNFDEAFDGKIDEVRISKVARSADWLATCCNNQRAPAAFALDGGEQTRPSQWPAGYGYRRLVTIDADKVPGTVGLENFPALIRVADTRLCGTNYGGCVASANGYDILFTAADGATQLDHETELYVADPSDLSDPTDPTYVGWVRIPVLDPEEDTRIWMYYGNANVSSSRENAAGVWDADYIAVWHLKEGAGTNVADSTKNGHDGFYINTNDTSWAGATNAAIGVCADFTASEADDDYILVPDSPLLDLTGNTYTVEAWLHPRTGGGDDEGRVLTKDEWYLKVGNWPTYDMTFATDNAADKKRLNTASPFDLNQWNHVAFHADAGVGGWLVNGTASSTFGTLLDNSDVTTDLYIGINTSLGYDYDGWLDELRISRVARSTNWLAACHNNQADPSSFYTLGPVQRPWTGGCQYRKRLIIDGDTVGGDADLINFPYLFSLTDSDLANTNSGGYVCHTNGYDILFTAQDGVTQLDHEIETYTAASGALVAWVRIPVLSATSDTTNWVYFHNPHVTNSQENVRGVWDDTFLGVWHMNNDPSAGGACVLDSTANGEDGTPTASMTADDLTAGLLGDCLEFDGDDQIEMPVIVNDRSEYTLSMWWNTTSTSSARMWREGGTNALNELTVCDNPPPADYDDLAWQIRADNDVWGGGNSGSQSVANGQWRLAAAVSYSKSERRLYLDTICRMTNVVTLDALTMTNAFMGSTGAGWGYYTGRLDELRIESVARSAGWLATVYTNMLAPAAGLTVGSAEAVAWKSGYLYRKLLKIESDRVGPSTDSGFTDFPALVSRTDNALRTVGHGGRIYSAAGYDIIFTDSDGETPLDHELEAYTEDTGELVSWVRIPHLPDDADTYIYMYYGNSSVSASQERATNVWDASYVGVWHLKESPADPAPQMLDSTVYTNDGVCRTLDGSDQVGGQIGNALYFAGGDQLDAVNVGSDSSLDDHALFTVSAWIKADSASSSRESIFYKAPRKLYLYQSSPNTRLKYRHYHTDEDGWWTDAGAVATGVWHHVALSYDKSSVANDPVMYIDGTSMSLEELWGPPVGAAASDAANNAFIGGSDNTWPYSFDGIIDEVRVSKVLRSAGWLATSYTNQVDPAGFVTAAGEEVSATLETTIAFTALASSGSEANTPVTLEVSLSPAIASEVSVQYAVTGGSAVNGTDYTLAGGTLTIDAGLTAGDISIAIDDDAESEANETIVVTLSNPSANAQLGANTAHTYTILDNDTTYWTAGYMRRMAITIDSDKVSGTADLTNFPALVSLTDPDLKSQANGGYVYSAAGYDVIFTSDDGKTRLDHEMERYTATSGEVVAWVRIPVLDHDDDTVIYLYYGKPNVTRSEEHPTAVWDSNHLGVWHLTESAGTVNYDSTANAHDCAKYSASQPAYAAAGRVGGAQEFDGTANSYTLDDDGESYINGLTAFTLSAWLNSDVMSTDKGWATATNATGSDHTFSFRYDVEGTGGGATNTMKFGIDTSGNYNYECAANTQTDVWQHVSVAWSSGNDFTVYINGDPDTPSYTKTPVSGGITGATLFYIGKGCKDGSASWDGLIDEVRLSDNVRSADWIMTSYTNQLDAAGFVTTGAVERAATRWHEGFRYRKRIVLDADHVSGTENLANFPALIGLTDAAIKSTEHGGRVTSPAGYDIVFTDEAGANRLDHELEEYDAAAGAWLGWVRIPVLACEEDTVIWMYYGNESVTATQENPGGVWDAGFMAVWHLGEDPDGPAPQILDSTTNANHGNVSNLTAGYQLESADSPLGAAIQFNDTNSFIDVAGVSGASSLDLNGTTATFEAWAKTDIAGGVDYDEAFFVKGPAYNDECYMMGAEDHATDPYDNAHIRINSGTAAGTGMRFDVPNEFPTNGWVYEAAIYDGAYLRLYVNGLEVSNAVFTTAIANDATSTNDIFYIGKRLPYEVDPTGVFAFEGQLDEIRISDIARTEAWMVTAYSNALDPAALVASVGDEAFGWQDGYRYRKRIVIDKDTVSGSTDLADFPYLISLTDGDLARTNYGGQVCSSSGHDLIFSDGDGKLDHEVESYSGSTGALLAWVRVPVLHVDRDTILYLYYGNPNIVDSQQNPESVWDHHYKAVWHLHETSGWHYDSSAYGNDAYPTGDVNQSASGAIDGAAAFNEDLGDDDNLHIAHSDSLAITEQITLEAWIRQDGPPDEIQKRIVQKHHGINYNVYGIFYDNETNLHFRITANDGAEDTIRGTPELLPTGVWGYVAATFDDSIDTAILYVNGAVDTTSNNVAHGICTTNADWVEIGGVEGRAERGFNGPIDEVRISDIVRSGDWLATCHTNMADPGACVTVEDAERAPWKTGYPYRKLVRIASDLVTETLTNFPALISLTDAELATTANGGHVADSDGYDILFTALDGTTQLDHEIESYVTNGTFVGWVRVPLLAHDRDTYLWLYYGNPTVTSSPERAEDVWTNGYVGVWHLSESPTNPAPQVLDSTATGADATCGGTMDETDLESARINGGLHLDGSDDTMSNTVFTAPTSAFTYSAWFAPDTELTSGSARQDFVGGLDPTRPHLTFNRETDGKIGLHVTVDASGYDDVKTTQTSWSGGQWYHVAVSWDGADFAVYVDGLAQGAPITHAGAHAASTGVIMGTRAAGDTPFDGLLDEIRISDVARSAGWLAACYTNQVAPAAFVTTGEEETPPTTTVAFTLAAASGCETCTPVLVEIKPARIHHEDILVDYTVAGSATAQIDHDLTNGTVTIPAGLSATHIAMSVNNDSSGEQSETVVLTLSNPTNATLGANAEHVYTILDDDLVLWRSGYARRMAITIDSSKISGTEPLTNFPVLIDITDPELATRANGGYVRHASAYDILFTTDDGATRLDHEIETHWADTGHLVAWVRIASLPTDEDTLIYLYYGNPYVTVSQENAPAVWPDYVAVWHLDETGEMHVDSTGHAYDGYNRGNTTYLEAGKIGRCATFDGTTDYIPISNLYYNTSGGITEIMVETWVRSASSAGQSMASWDRSESWRFAFNESTGIGWDTAHASINDMYSPSSYYNDEWHYIVGWFKNGESPDKLIFIDGAVVVSNTIGSAMGTAVTRYGYLGCNSEATAFNNPAGGGTYLNGELDEFRICGVARSMEWLMTSHTNQADAADFISVAAPEQGPDVWKGGWLFRRKITIDADLVSPSTGSGTNHVDFPALVSLTDAELATVANGGRVMHPDGYDIIFTDADGVTQLDHEIEVYTQTTGEYVGWVRIPVLDCDNDTVIWMCYGNREIAGNTQNKTGVWADYDAVWHLKEPATYTRLEDSGSLNNYACSSNGCTLGATGQIGPAVALDGVDQFLEVNRVNNDVTTDMSLSAWVKAPGIYTGTRCGSVIGLNDSAGGNKFIFSLGTTSTGDDNEFMFYDVSAWEGDSGTVVADNAWHYLTYTRAGSTGILYVDGAQEATHTANFALTATDQWSIGMEYDTAEITDQLEGTVDEVRVCALVRSADWIATVYTNQVDPAGFCAIGDQEGGWRGGYRYRKALTVDGDCVGGTDDLPDFPFLVHLTDSDLAWTDNGGQVRSASGYDIVFSDGAHPLDHEVEQYTSASGELIAWVRIPVLHATEDTTFYVYYGNPDVNYATENPTAVWDAHAAAVWHMAQDPADPAPQVLDSTANTNHGTCYGLMDGDSRVAARIGYGLHFETNSGEWAGDYIEVPSSNVVNSLDITGHQLTLQAWAKLPAYVQVADTPFMNMANASNDNDVIHYMLGNRDDTGASNDFAHCRINMGDPVGGMYVDGSNAFPRGVWVHEACVYDGSTVRLYVDGVLVTTSNYTDTIRTDTIDQFRIGTGVRYARFENVTMDELRVCDTARSEGWVQTCFTNQAAPAACIATGERESRWHDGYLYRKAIRIESDLVDPSTDSGQGGTANLTDFPALISLTDSELAVTNEGGRLTSTNGYDMVFTAGDGQTRLDHEIERYVTNGTLVAWVRVPELSGTEDTYVYLYYGNAAVDTSQENVTGVWDIDYDLVLHLAETEGTNYADSTRHAHHGSQTLEQYPTPADGCMAGGQSFDGATNSIYLGDERGFVTNCAGFTFSAWMFQETTNAGYIVAVSITNDLPTGQSRAQLITAHGGKLRVEGRAPDEQASLQGEITADPIPTGTWVHVAGVADVAGDDVVLYVDGTARATTDTPAFDGGLTQADPARCAAVGSEDYGSGAFFQGVLDEVRVSRAARSAGWIRTCYNNQSLPALFAAALSETEPATVQFTATESSWPERLTEASIPLTLSAALGTEVTVDYQITGGTALSGTDYELADGTVTFPVLARTTNLVFGVVDDALPESGETIVLTLSNPVNALLGANTVHTFTIQDDDGAWAAGYAHRKRIVVPAASVSGGQNLTDFPLLVSFAEPGLRATIHGGHVAHTNGYDIVFTAADGTTPLDHENERYRTDPSDPSDPTDPGYVAWVRIPALSASQDTVLYMYYGNPSISASQENATGVWDANYKIVHHLEETAGTNYTDSTANQVDAAATNAPAPASGKIGGAQDFDGTDDWLDLGADRDILNQVTACTIETWIRPDIVTTSEVVSIGINNGGTPTASSRANLQVRALELLGGARSTDGESQQSVITTTSAVESGAWHHLVVVVEYPTDTIACYVDGQAQAATGTPSFSATNTPNTVSTSSGLGSEDDGSSAFVDGLLDEIRVSDVARSAGWLATCYANQSDPARFYAARTERKWLSGYRYRRAVAIDADTVSGSSDLTNFPFLVSVTDAALADTAHGGHVTSGAGHDIIFTAQDGLTQLDHEVEKYTNTTGELVAWVRIPVLSCTSETTNWLYYGNPSITESQANAAGVWDSDYVAVWHLSETNAQDSTANANHGTPGAGVTLYAGAVAGAGCEFNGVDNEGYIQSSANTNALNAIKDALTIEAWCCWDQVQSDARILVGRQKGTGGDDLW